MTKPILIYGAGGLGREVLSVIRSLPEWSVQGFIDDAMQAGTLVDGFEVKGSIKYLNAIPHEVYVCIAIGNPHEKLLTRRNINNARVKFPVIIHPKALLQNTDTISIAEGSFIGAGVILTTGITIGKHVLLNLNVTIGHDCVIGDFSSIMPGVNISGNVSVGKGVFIGAGANIRNKIIVADLSVVGMGSVVVHHVPDRAVVAGVPAKPLDK